MHAPRTKPRDESRSIDEVHDVFVMQGGGSLGAFQAGVYQALDEAGVVPDWIAGISIGAINGAIIAGNAPQDRVPALRKFWDLVSSDLLYHLDEPIGFARRAFNEACAAFGCTVGVPGFFNPRIPMPLPNWPHEMAQLSYYDTTPLRHTLLDIVDFDRINHKDTRLSVGAVNIRNGNFAYFDNHEREIRVEHIMASGALPPGLPAVEVDGEWYWDGALLSNTPLQFVLDHRETCHMNVFQVDLFAATGEMPRTMADIAQREKDIRFSSRTRLNTDMNRRLQKLGAAARRLRRKLPEELQDDPDLALLLDYRPEGPVAIMHLINRGHGYETNSKDYEFSRMTVNEHWNLGYQDAMISLNHPDWVNRSLKPDEIATFDLVGGSPLAG